MSQMIAGILTLVLALVGASAISTCVGVFFGNGWSYALMPVWFWFGWKLLETINFRSQKDSLHV